MFCYVPENEIEWDILGWTPSQELLAKYMSITSKVEYFRGSLNESLSVSSTISVV